ncbi:hypothetical protein [Bacteroides ovatus]|uniref:hypothetical protein n=1 Tax=Bacteroides ovatus TaxID=28116 RepID=UPI003567BC51
MINQHFYIARLIARYLSDEIGEEEQAELTRWRNESPENGKHSLYGCAFLFPL